MNLVVPPPEGALPTLDILGIAVAELDRDQAIRLLTDRLAAPGLTRVAFVNAHCINTACVDPAYREALGRFIVLADGVGVDFAASELHGRPFPANLNGTDFIPDLVAAIAAPARIALLGARSDRLDHAASALQAIAPRHTVRIVCDGYFGEDDIPAILADLAADRPDLLLIAMGVPRQELFIAGHLSARHCSVAVGVGALFDFLSGAVPRAPDFMRRHRLEWLFRLALEPTRLWRRYVIGNPVFMARVLARKWALRRR